MKSPSQMSKEIRMKKKAMLDNRDVVDLSGIPMDKTDIDIMDNESYTKELGLDHNEPMERSEEPSMHEDMATPSAESLAADAQERQMEQSPAEARKARLMKMMGRR